LTSLSPRQLRLITTVASFSVPLSTWTTAGFR
jgi:hypothetical protein